MASKSRRYLEARAQAERETRHSLSEGVRIVRELATAKFDETVEMCVLLGVNPRDSEQVVRGTCVLPHGTGRTVRVLALVRGEHADEAEEAGADYVGDEEYVEKIEEGWLDFEVVVATPDMMRDIGKLGRILGPRGLMPSPKTGTLTEDVSKAVREAKAGKISFRVDRQGNLHAPIGKASFDPEALEQNAMTLVEKLTQLRPSSSKGPYLRRAALSSTMGPGIKIDVSDLRSRLLERGVR